MKTAFFPGSFDPPTNGHLDIIARAARLFGRVVVGIGINMEKRTALSFEDRRQLFVELVGPIARATGAEIEVVSFTGLTVDAARKVGAGVILRGVRDVDDFSYEMRLAGLNGALSPAIDTLFLPATSGLGTIASSFVKDIARHGGDISAFVPPQVADRLRAVLAVDGSKPSASA